MTDTEKRLLAIERLLERNTVTLEEHVRRTNILQEELDIVYDQLKPIAVHVAVVGAVGKLLVGAIPVLGGLYWLLKHLL